MPFTVACPQCRQPLQIPDAMIGQAVRCPKCRAALPPQYPVAAVVIAAPAPTTEPPQQPAAKPKLTQNQQAGIGCLILVAAFVLLGVLTSKPRIFHDDATIEDYLEASEANRREFCRRLLAEQGWDRPTPDELMNRLEQFRGDALTKSTPRRLRFVAYANAAFLRR